MEKINIIINKDKITASPLNLLSLPIEPKSSSFNTNEEYLIAKEKYIIDLTQYDIEQAKLPKYKIKGTMCKSGIYLDANILNYTALDKREAELIENEIIIYGPYK